MNRKNLSMKLRNCLQNGIQKLGSDATSAITGFVHSQVADEGGFIGKNGHRDVYYTTFGLLLALELNIPLNTRQLKAYLNRINAQELDLVHYASYVRCKMLSDRIDKGLIPFLWNTLLSTYKRDLPSTIANQPHPDNHSPYSSFMWLSLMEDLGLRVRHPQDIIASLNQYQIATGGYANIIGAGPSINATAAALAVVGQLSGYRDNKDIRYLYDMQDDTGGFKATETSPVPDLLSTATSLFVLNCYGMKPRVSPNDFIDAHWLPSGGFAATLLDDESDVEYTFYGLLALGA